MPHAYGATWLTALSTIIKTSNEGVSFGRMVFVPRLELQRCGESEPRSTEAVLDAGTRNIGLSYSISFCINQKAAIISVKFHIFK